MVIRLLVSIKVFVLKQKFSFNYKKKFKKKLYGQATVGFP